MATFKPGLRAHLREVTGLKLTKHHRILPSHKTPTVDFSLKSAAFTKMQK